jgi:hypothetical protein
MDAMVYTMEELVQWYRDNVPEFSEYECQIMAQRDYDKE